MHAISPKEQSAGFSLIELMVTISVLAVIVGIGLPSFTDLITSQRVRAATSAIHDSLTLARSEAIKRNANVSLTTTDLASGWTVTSSSGVTLRSEEGSKNLTFTPSNPNITFNSAGRLPPGDDNKIEVSSTNSEKKYCITIDNRGRASSTSGACDDA